MENIQRATGNASELVKFFEELKNSKKYDPEMLVFVASAVANLELVDRTKRFGGLDPVKNPLLFSAKLANACARRYSWEIWKDLQPKSKSETALRGYDTMDVLQGTGPYTEVVKPTHWTLVYIYVAHEARAHFGLVQPNRVPVEKLTWLEERLAKELSPEDLTNLEKRACDTARRAAKYGKIKSSSEFAVQNYAQATYNGLVKEQNATRRIARQNMLHIADMMCDPAYTVPPVGVDEAEINKRVAKHVTEYLGNIVEFLTESLDRMERLAKSAYGLLGHKANETIKCIEYALEYAYTDEHAAELKKREEEADLALANFTFRR